jgi:hypothetical protein
VTVGRATVGVLLAVGSMLLTGCGDPSPKPSYDPVPDTDLFAQVEKLPGVRSADLEYSDSFANPNEYAGTVTVARTADVAGVVDRMCALLWQGRPEVSVHVTVSYGSREVTTADLRLSTPDDLERRYGSQPGSGEPPPSATPLRVPGTAGQ